MSAPIRLAFVFGTRPEAIKLAVPILRAQHDSRFEVSIISTGQHREMMQPILEFFGIQPHYDLNLMKHGQTLGEIFAQMLLRLNELWSKERPDLVIIQGDTTTCAAATVAAFYLQIPLAHVEAGLRTHDLSSPFPEEYNRRLVGLTAQLNFAPTESARNNLLTEGVSPHMVWTTGNTGIDTLLAARERIETDVAWQIRLAEDYPEVAQAIEAGRKIVLVTTHRRESFGEPLRATLRALLRIALRSDVLVVLPVHRNPAVRDAVAEVLGDHSPVLCLEPLDYIPFVWLMSKSTIILTDSGGVQEEAPSLGKPVLVLRDNTERPEAIDAGTARLVGTDEERICREAQLLLDRPELRAQMVAQSNPFGDGRATRRILNYIVDHFARCSARAQGDTQLKNLENTASTSHLPSGEKLTS